MPSPINKSSKVLGLSNVTTRDETKPPIPMPRFSIANCAPYMRSRICSGVNSVEIAFCDGHIADCPVAQIVVTKTLE